MERDPYKLILDLNDYLEQITDDTIFPNSKKQLNELKSDIASLVKQGEFLVLPEDKAYWWNSLQAILIVHFQKVTSYEGLIPWKKQFLQIAKGEMEYDPDHFRGLYHKYDVFKAGTKDRVEKCIVLKIDDPLAKNALIKWANDMNEAGYQNVKKDLYRQLDIDDLEVL